MKKLIRQVAVGGRLRAQGGTGSLEAGRSVGGGGLGCGRPGVRGDHVCGSVLLHLWDELEERVREQRSNGQGDEVSEHAAEKRFLRARQDEGSQQRGQVNQGHTEETKAPHCGGTETGEGLGY